MHILIGIALKSLLISGLALGLLQLMKNRSAAERSWVAHIGLLSLVIMALAPLAMPHWNVEAPAIFGGATDSSIANQSVTPTTATQSAAPISTAPIAKGVPVQASATLPSLSAAAAATALYAVPAAILIFITMLALVRLVILRARADVLVDGHWLSALARAQRRMGFKHGTALLTSNELASPISWGLMRPVIVLNTRAVEAAGEAEAIIAHELAHVARMDWIKLLLARFATALFWFNPLVWLLAREAHQLREEAADDSVLAADIVDTDYAQLLVGVARHECPGLLLGAHGVAPSKSSLARRVARVLDGKSVRGPVARSFALGVFAGAVVVAAPLAAITLTPAGTRATAPKSSLSASEPSSAYYPAQDEPTDLPHIIAKGVATSVSTATAAIVPQVTVSGDTVTAVSPNGATVHSANGMTVTTAPNGAKVTVYPPDAKGRRKVVAIGPNGETAVSYADNDGAEAFADARGRRTHDDAIDMAIGMKAVGLTPEYAAAMRSALPGLRNASMDDLMGLKAVGVTPEYAREIAAAGYPNLDASQLDGAKAVGLDPGYMRAIRSTGVNPSLDDLVAMRAMGIRPDELARVREVMAHDRAAHPPRPPEPPSSDNDDD